MSHIIVAGIGTDVGKTVVSAILTTLLKGEYWKPIECGVPGDTSVMRSLIDPQQYPIHEPMYSFKNPVSPHHAARLENSAIAADLITIPKSGSNLIIESAGGVLTPITMDKTNMELFKKWNYKWVVVSKHYLGSINHTLLTIDALQRNDICIAGIIFNGSPYPDSEQVILKRANVPCIGRLQQEARINKQVVQKYADQWGVKCIQYLH